MKHLLAIILVCLLYSCKKVEVANAPSVNISNSSGSKPSYSSADSCAVYDALLNGTFGTLRQKGSMIWSGGRTGKMEAAGVDYNDITCTYTITNCSMGEISMNCGGGSPFNAVIKVVTLDTFYINATQYIRQKPAS